jgi:hypothetical protein
MVKRTDLAAGVGGESLVFIAPVCTRILNLSCLSWREGLAVAFLHQARDHRQEDAKALVSVRVYHPDTPRSIVLYKQNAGLYQRLAVMLPNDLVPDRRNVAVIRHQRREKRWPELNTAVLQ